jgi:hypothetical protein
MLRGLSTVAPRAKICEKLLLNSVLILSMSPLTVAANTVRFCKLSRMVWVVAMESMVARRIITLYIIGPYSMPSKVYSLR